MTNDTSPHGPGAPREKSKRAELQELQRLTEEGQRQQEIDRMMAEAKANGLPLSIVQHHRAGERMISRTDLQDFADNIGALLHCTPSTAYASLHDAHQRGMEILASHVGTPRMAPDYYMAAARHAAKTPEFYTAMRSLMIAHKI